MAFRFLSTFGLLSFMLLSLCLPCFADDVDNFSGLEEPAPYTGQGYVEYPAPAQQPQQQEPPKDPWYVRMFGGGGGGGKKKHDMMHEADKIPKGPPKETEELPDPLLRLAKGVSYGESSVPAGFYILKLQSTDEDPQPSLLIMRESQPLMSVPIATSEVLPFSSSLPSPPSVEEQQQAPEEHHHRHGGRHGGDESAGGERGKTKKPQDTKGLVEMSTDGQTMILVYQKGNHKYVSQPLAVTTP
jgi:hypothetical protein